MPPAVDIYGITRRCDRATVKRFIACYADASRPHGGAHSLNLAPPEHGGDPWEVAEYVEAPTLAALLDVVYARPDRRILPIYLSPSPHDPELYGAILVFTTDGQLVLGVSVDEGEFPLEQADAIAGRVLPELCREFDCWLGLAALEYPPPRDTAEFLEGYADESASPKFGIP